MFSKKKSKKGFNYIYKQSKSAKEKQKNRLSFSRISSLKSAKLALPIVFVLFFGSLGIYKLMSSKAATVVNGNVAIGDMEYDSTNGMFAGYNPNPFGGDYISRDGQISIEQKTYNVDENGNQTGQYTGDLTLVFSYRDRPEKKEVLINGSNFIYETHGQMSWSYDSKNLVFIAQSKTLGERLIVASEDGSGYEVYAKTGEEGVDSLNSVGWTRDGQILYVENGKNFCRKSLDNYSPKCVEINLPIDENNSVQPSLLGQLEVNQDNNTVFATGWPSIYKFNMDGSNATKAAKLSDNTLRIRSIAISPDGQKLAVYVGSIGHLYVLPVSELTSKRTLNITNDFLLRPAIEETSNGSMVAWFAYERPKGWSSWESMGGNFVDSPTVASWGSGRLDVFARGTKNDMVHKWYASGYGWLGWESLGGDITSSPSAVSWGKDRIDIFARGKNGDVVHKWYASGYGWLGWESLGGGIIGAPSVISTGSGKLDVFVRGTNNILHRKNFDGKKWSGWQNLGVTIDAQPVALKKQNSIFVYVKNDEGRVITIIGTIGDLDTPDSWSKTDNKYPMEEGRVGVPSFITSVSYDNLPVVHAFRRSTHGRLYYRPPTTYKDEMFADSEITSSPAGVSWGGTRLDVFARGTNGDLLHIFKQ